MVPVTFQGGEIRGAALYPNPMHDLATFETDVDLISQDVTLEIGNILGRPLRHIPLTGQQTVFSRDDMPAGIYYYRLVRGSSIVAKGRLVIE
jgi:hypothetical protein